MRNKEELDSYAVSAEVFAQKIGKKHLMKLILFFKIFCTYEERGS